VVLGAIFDKMAKVENRTTVQRFCYIFGPWGFASRLFGGYVVDPARAFYRFWLSWDDLGEMLVSKVAYASRHVLQTRSGALRLGGGSPPPLYGYPRGRDLGRG